jgi:hypothetical protein
VLLAPVKPAAAWAVVLAHAPFNEPGAMGPDAVNGLVESGTLLAAPEPGVAAARVAVWAEPWSSGKTLIAAYAYATSRPVRTAAEHLDPGRFLTVSDGCLTDQITVNGVPQPLVWDNDGGLGKMIRSLLGR